MVKEQYPARKIRVRNRDFKSTRVPIPFPMGVSDWFLDTKEEIINHLVRLMGDLERVYDYRLKWFERESDRELPIPVIINMKPNALAKSHRPEYFFDDVNATLISIHGIGKIVISVYDYTISMMIEKIENLMNLVPENVQDWIYEIETPKGRQVKIHDQYKNLYRLIHELTAISSIESYVQEDVLKLMTSKRREEVIEDRELKVRFFNFKDDSINIMYLKEFQSYFRDRGVKVNRIRKVNFVEDLITFAVPFNNIEVIDTLSRFPSIESISSFARFKTESGTNIKEVETLKIISPNNDKTYPKLAIIDSGIAKSNPYFHDWVEAEYSTVATEYQDNYHGEFVAGMTIYSNSLNPNITNNVDTGVKILNVVAIPDETKEVIREDDLLQTLEEALDIYSDDFKVWNLSLGTDEVAGVLVSEFTAAIDVLQDKYNVIFVISAGNYDKQRIKWPINDPISEPDDDRVTSPADSVRGITVGAIALESDSNSLIQKNDVVTYSRRGPGIGMMVKPDLVHYSGNANFPINSVTSKGISGDFGTSFSTPLVSALLAEIYSLYPEKLSTTTAKAILIHSARNPKGNNLVKGKDQYYLGFGLPNTVEKTLYGDEHSITLIFEGTLDYSIQKNWIEIGDFPFPESLCASDKIRGEVLITLCYEPPLKPQYGSEYCRSNVDIRLIDNSTGETITKGPSLSDMDNYDRWEKTQMTKMLKWSPIKQQLFYKPRGGKGSTDIRLELYPTWRDSSEKSPIPFSVIVTIRDPKNEAYVYNDVVQKLNQSFVSEEVHLTTIPVRVRQDGESV
ncbi:S8 family peptidase [Lysinibacillus fusiformis]|uniref:S8 family peptidase n=1 Tax=Lysinibacillus fusiformis TaxID=28031 RepID=UPI002E9F63D9|nr:S8 family peptidase [Lysinibacillus fusiformis]